MMADLMGYNIGLRKLTRRMETVLQVPIELKVNIDLIVPGAVKRAHGRLGKSAGRIDRISEEDQFWLLIGLTAAAEHFVPCVLSICKNYRHEFGHPVFLSRPLLRNRPG